MISIRQQLTRNLLGAVILLLVAGIGALYFAAREAATDQFDDAMSAKALAVSTLTFRTNEGVRLDFTDRFLRGFDDQKPRDFFQLWDETGREIARSESLPAGQALPRNFGKPERPAKWNFTLPNGRPGRALGFVFKPKSAEPRRPASAAPDLQLVVASDRDDLDDTLWSLLGSCCGWGALLIGATLWIIPRVLRRGLKPLGDLGEQSAQIHADSLATRFEVAQLPEELQPIARQLNELLGRLEQSFERERRFSADLAHELRTPLAELRTIAECALKWPETRDPSVDDDTLAIARQMEQLVAHILALARGEQGQLAVRLEPITLAPFVETVWRRFAERAQSRGLHVTLKINPVEAVADSALLTSILGNLCENAVDYAAPGGDLELTVSREADEVVIVVANTTHELRADDVPRLFDRFWRKEAARSGGLHLGLGLALSRNFAQAMHGSLTAELADERKIAFALRVPARVAPTLLGSTAPLDVSASA